MNSTDTIPSVPDFNGTIIISEAPFDSAHVLSVICLFVGLLGFPSNAFALFILLQKRAIRQRFSSILFLSVIGSSVCGVDVPLNFVFILTKANPRVGPVLCVLREMARFMLDPLLFFTTCLIAIERYRKIGIMNPTSLPVKMVFCICLSPFLVTVPLVIILLVTAIGVQNSNKNFALQFCINPNITTDGIWKQIQQYTMPCLFLLTLSIMTVLYILIILSLKQTATLRTSRYEMSVQNVDRESARTHTTAAYTPGFVNAPSRSDRAYSTVMRAINRARVSPDPISEENATTLGLTASVAEHSTYPNVIRHEDRSMSTKRKMKGEDNFKRSYSRKYFNTDKMKSTRSQSMVLAKSRLNENGSRRNDSVSSGITRRSSLSSVCCDSRLTPICENSASSGHVDDNCETGGKRENFERRVKKFGIEENEESDTCTVSNEETASTAFQCSSNMNPPTIRNSPDVAPRTSHPSNRRKTQLHRRRTASVQEALSREAYHHYFNFSSSKDIILRSAQRRCIILVLQFGVFFLPTCFIQNVMINFSDSTEVSLQAALISDSIKNIYYAIMPILYVFTNTVLLTLVYANLRKLKIIK